jgi:hypothetical protein
MLKEEYFGVFAEVNSAYLKSITGLMKQCLLYNLVYSSNKASGSSFPYEEYIKAELSHSKSPYAISQCIQQFI